MAKWLLKLITYSDISKSALNPDNNCIVDNYLDITILYMYVKMDVMIVYSWDKTRLLKSHFAKTIVRCSHIKGQHWPELNAFNAQITFIYYR